MYAIFSAQSAVSIIAAYFNTRAFNTRYILDQGRIKDLRTNVEIGNTQGVLDGDLDPFIQVSLKQGV